MLILSKFQHDPRVNTIFLSKVSENLTLFQAGYELYRSETPRSIFQRRPALFKSRHISGLAVKKLKDLVLVLIIPSLHYVTNQEFRSDSTCQTAQ